MIYDVTEGQTRKLKFRLKYVDDDGIVQTFDTTGMTITLSLTNADGIPVDTAGDLMPLLPGSSGLVEYSPDAGDFVAANGPYYQKFRVVDGTGLVDFFPRGEHDICRISTP